MKKLIFAGLLILSASVMAVITRKPTTLLPQKPVTVTPQNKAAVDAIKTRELSTKQHDNSDGSDDLQAMRDLNALHATNKQK